MRKIGLLGCGSIGTTIAEAVQRDSSIHADLVGLFDRESGAAERLKRELPVDLRVAHSFEEFLELPFDLLVECASQEAVKNYAEKALRRGRDLLIMSVGALLDEPFWRRLSLAATEQRRNLYLPSGAIGGLDLVRAASEGRLYEVCLTTKKHPHTLSGAPYFQARGLSPDDIRERTLLYEGTAQEAVKLFPANVNVAAVLSLAGLGGLRTKVRVIADPELTANIHEIEVKGDFGEAKMTVKNLPHPNNPKTSYLAALSAIETLRRACLKGGGLEPGR